MIETTTFRLAEGVDQAEFLEVDEEVRTGFLYHQPGMMRATTARADDGEWITIVLWASYEHADAAAEVELTNTAVERFGHMVTDAERKRYSLLE